MSKRLTCLVVLVLALSLAGGAWADLVGHWRFDEGAGTVATDSSGNGYDGTLNGTMEWVPGQLGSALQCDGDDWVDCGDILTLTEQLSITCWVNPSALDGDRGFVTREASYAFKSYDNTLRFTTPGVLDYNGSNTIIEIDTWQHVAVTFVPNQSEGLIFYLNGIETDRIDSTGVNAGAGPFRMGNNQWGQLYFGVIDDVQVYDHILTQEEVAQTMQGAGKELAVGPSPENEVIDVPREVVLSWTPGEFAVAHDVYLGAVFDDVNDASRADGMGVLVSQGQAAASYDPDGLLDFGVTYYWRIDEVNGTPDNTVFKGGVWSFTSEPLAYPIETVVATTNGAAQAGAVPESIVDGSGLNENDEHSTNGPDMWLAKQVGDESLYIEFEFDRIYKVHEILVWNYNVQFEVLLGFGIQNATVEYSENGVDWAVLGDVDLAQGTTQSDYVANTAIDMQGVAAQYVRLTVNSGFGTMGQFGLSEVRFMQIPAQAREPQPDDGAMDVSVGTMLAWRAGRDAITHEVNLGTDPNALALADAVDAPSFDPGALDLGTTYYWKVDAIQDVDSWEGDLWSFATQDFLTVDDFESYTDDEGSRIYESWIDGYDVTANGSTVGHLDAPFAEMEVVHGGSQSMPLFYGNAGAAVSEAEFALDQDWTGNNIKSLSLYFQGAAGNGGQLYVKINDTKVLYDGAATDIVETVWLPWNIDLSTVGGNLSSVTTLTIGIEGAGAEGVMYIDDIRLYPQAPELVVPVMPDEANLMAYYAFEGDFSDSVGAHNGAGMGDATIVNDPAQGQVLSLDGGADAVEIAYSADLNPEAFTASFWANPDPAGSNHRSPITSRDDGPQRGYIMYLEPGNTWQFWTGTGTGWDNAAGPAAVMGEWTHLAGTFADETKSFYVNGRLAAESTAPLSLNTAQPLRIGAGATEGPGNYFFQGMIDEARIYNRALSAEEVAGLAGRTEPLHKSF